MLGLSHDVHGAVVDGACHLDGDEVSWRALCGDQVENKGIDEMIELRGPRVSGVSCVLSNFCLEPLVSLMSLDPL